MSEPAISIKSIFRNYAIQFESAKAALSKQAADPHCFFIVDRELLNLYDWLKPLLPQEKMILIEANENSKTFQACDSFIQQLLAKGIRRNDTLVAIGGGVIQDLVAFTASILFRGVSWEFYPTTLLAQADSCIGSKTSINFAGSKNLIGNFYPPSRILIDISFLNTLPLSEIKSGIGEILHYYFVANSTKVKDLINRYDIFLKTPALLEPHILESLNTKKRMIEVDEFDRGPRNVFNYGHTFGHALETVSEYTVSHGEAVTLGMDIANFCSVRLGHLTDNDYESMHRLLEKNIPAYTLDHGQLDAFLKALSKDKKNEAQTLGCILTQGLGKMFKAQVPMDEKLRKILGGYWLERSAVKSKVAR